MSDTLEGWADKLEAHAESGYWHSAGELEGDLIGEASVLAAALRLASCATVEGVAGVLMRDCGFCQAQGSPCERHQFEAERVVAYLKGET